MKEPKWWETLLVVGAVAVGLVILLKLVLARSRTVVQAPQGNPLVAAIDAAPAFVRAVGTFFTSTTPSNGASLASQGVSASDIEQLLNVN